MPTILKSLWSWTRTIVPLVVSLAGLVLLIAWLSGMFLPKIEPGAVEPSRPGLAGRPTDLVHEVTKDYVEEAVGAFKAASRTVISARILATIIDVEVAAGDEVQAGDILVRLDDQAQQSQLKQAEQALRAAEATEREAESLFRRIEKLVVERAASQADLDQATRNLEVGKANVLRAEQSLQEAKVMLSHTVIAAPKNGRIVDRLAEPGDTSRPGEPLLVLYDAESLRLEAPVPEQLAVRMKTGDHVQVMIDSLQTTVTGTVDEIVPQADAPSRSLLVKASVPRAPELYEGMFGRLLIPAGQRRHLCLNADAIRRVGQLEFVDVVDENDQVRRRLITTGRLGMPGRVEVLSGLKAGERVVLQAPAPSADADQPTGE